MGFFPNIQLRLELYALSLLNVIGWGRSFLFVVALVLLCFYISWKPFKSGNTLYTKYLHRIANPTAYPYYYFYLLSQYVNELINELIILIV